MIESDAQALGVGRIIELYELDLTGVGGDVERWHDGVNEFETDVVWGGETFYRLPIVVTGYEKRSAGPFPRPVLRISNVFGDVSAEARRLGGFETGKLTRIKTMVKYLDAANFAGGNPDANPLMKFPDEIYFIDQLKAETATYMEYELKSSMDVAGTKLPRREMMQNVCGWGYRSDECGYTGGAVADESDTPTADPQEDSCGKRLASCKLRFGENGELPFGAFPSVGLVR